MKIGIDVSALSSKNTGTGRFISCLLEQLESSQHCFEKFPPNIKKFSNNILPCLSAMPNGQPRLVNRQAGKPADNRVSVFARNLSLINNKHIYREFFLKNEMKINETDCAIFPDYFLPHSFNKPAAIVIHDISFITHPHFYSRRFIYFYKWKLKDTLSQNPVIAVVSENTKRNVIKYLAIKEENIFLLQGYPDKIINPVKNFSEPYLLYVGHIEPRKNLLFMINNFLKWKHSRNIHIKLKLAGELWISSAETRELLSLYKNHPDVEILGYVNEDKLKELYQNASGFLHTSFVEGFGFPIAEAMKYSLPILCSRETACEEISFPYSITINPNDNFSMLKGLDDLYALISDKQKIFYMEKYSPQLMNSQLNIILEKLEDKLNGKKLFQISRTNNVYEAIEKTLLYAKLHNSGISKVLLHERLFDIKISDEKFNEALIKLYMEGKIFFSEDMVYLNDTEKFHKNRIAGGKITRAKLLLKILLHIPFISGIAFSGGTAHYGIDEHDDVDLFFITKKYTLYLSYFIIHILSLLFRMRKEMCANYLIDEVGLNINSHRDFYTAYQIISLKIFKNKNLLNLFLLRNKWILNHFPNYKIELSDYTVSSEFFLLSPINKLLFKFYRFLYKGKIKFNAGDDSIILSNSCIKLHTNDHREKTIKSFNKLLQEYFTNKSHNVQMVNSKAAVGI